MKNLSRKILQINFLYILLQSETVKIADVAQLAEHLICNQAAVGSSPSIGSIEEAGTKGRGCEKSRYRPKSNKKGSYQSGQMGQTVNLLVFTFGGSNPSLPTLRVPIGVAKPEATIKRRGALVSPFL